MTNDYVAYREGRAAAFHDLIGLCSKADSEERDVTTSEIRALASNGELYSLQELLQGLYAEVGNRLRAEAEVARNSVDGEHAEITIHTDAAALTYAATVVESLRPAYSDKLETS